MMLLSQIMTHLHANKQVHIALRTPYWQVQFHAICAPSCPGLVAEYDGVNKGEVVIVLDLVSMVFCRWSTPSPRRKLPLVSLVLEKKDARKRKEGGSEPSSKRHTISLWEWIPTGHPCRMWPKGVVYHLARVISKLLSSFPTPFNLL